MDGREMQRTLTAALGETLHMEAPFMQAAKVQTMLRDFDKLRQAIRAHDSFATEEAWEKCERWVSLLPAPPGQSADRPERK
jgi:hypothetical protein